MARKQRSYLARDLEGNLNGYSFAIPKQDEHEDFGDEEHRMNSDEQLELFGATTILSPEELSRRSKHDKRFI